MGRPGRLLDDFLEILDHHIPAAEADDGIEDDRLVRLAVQGRPHFGKQGPPGAAQGNGTVRDRHDFGAFYGLSQFLEGEGSPELQLQETALHPLAAELVFYSHVESEDERKNGDLVVGEYHADPVELRILPRVAE